MGIAAGFAPLGLGTETAGSTVWPASRASLYAMKPTVGSVSMEGVFALSRTFDSIGVMAKSPQDVALLMSDLLIPDAERKLFQHGVTTTDMISWKNLTVGFVDCSVWEDPAMVIASYLANVNEKKLNTLLQKLEYEAAISKISDHGSRVIYPIELPEFSTVAYNGTSCLELVACSLIILLSRSSTLIDGME